MPLRVACTDCGADYSVPEEMVGKKVRCKQCQQIFTVAAPVEEEPAVVFPDEEPEVEPVRRAPERPRPSSRRRWRDEDDEDDERDRRGSGVPGLAWILGGGAALVLLIAGLIVLAVYLPRGRHAGNPVAANNPPWGPDWIDPEPLPGDPPVGPGPPPEIVIPPPPRPEPPQRPAFDDKLAKNVALANNRFEYRGTFEDTDPTDRNSQDFAKLFLIDLKQGEIYVGEGGSGDRFGGPALRLEDQAGRQVAVARQPRRGDGLSAFVFIPPESGTYRLVTTTPRPRDRVVVTLRRVEEGDALPDLEPRLDRPPTQTIQVARKLDHFLSAAIAPDSRSAWVSWPDKRLERFSCPDFVSTATYKLSKRTYRVALDGHGMLYAVSQLAENRPTLPWWDFARADLYVYDTNKLGDPKEVLKPTKILPIGGVVTHLILSPDDEWLYYLDTQNRKVGRVNLAACKLDGENGDLAPETNGLCLTPDGKRLYTCSKTGVVQVLDPATLTIEQTIRVPANVKPTGLQATDKGYVFLNPGEGQWTHIYLLYAGRDYKGQPASVIPWAGVYQTHSLALSPDQKTLYASCFNLSPSNITAYHVPERPTLGRGQQCGAVSLDGVNSQGQMYLSRDGTFLFSDRGLILKVDR